MTTPAPNYRGYRFSPATISHAVWLYHRFCLSFRDADVVVYLFSRGRHLLRARHQRFLRARAFATWNAVTAA